MNQIQSLVTLHFQLYPQLIYYIGKVSHADISIIILMDHMVSREQDRLAYLYSYCEADFAFSITTLNFPPHPSKQG